MTDDQIKTAARNIDATCASLAAGNITRQQALIEIAAHIIRAKHAPGLAAALVYVAAGRDFTAANRAGGIGNGGKGRPSA